MWSKFYAITNDFLQKCSGSFQVVKNANGNHITENYKLIPVSNEYSSVRFSRKREETLTASSRGYASTQILAPELRKSAENFFPHCQQSHGQKALRERTLQPWTMLLWNFFYRGTQWLHTSHSLVFNFHLVYKLCMLIGYAARTSFASFCNVIAWYEAYIALYRALSIS